MLDHAVSLRSLAHAFARLTLTDPDPIYGLAPQRVAHAMSRHPELVSGQGRNDLALMRAGRGDWVTKVGADGVQVGSRFAASVESSAHENFKSSIVKAQEGDTLLTMKQVTPVRLIKNRFLTII